MPADDDHFPLGGVRPRNFTESNIMQSWRGAVLLGLVFGLSILFSWTTRVAWRSSPKPSLLQKSVEIGERVGRHPAGPTPSLRMRPDRASRPPSPYDARLRFDLHETAGHTLLAAAEGNTSPIERIPPIMDDNFLPDMGRMTGRFALGRKAWLFVRSDRGGERTAIVLSHHHREDSEAPNAWLADVLNLLLTTLTRSSTSSCGGNGTQRRLRSRPPPARYPRPSPDEYVEASRDSMPAVIGVYSAASLRRSATAAAACLWCGGDGWRLCCPTVWCQARTDGPKRPFEAE